MLYSGTNSKCQIALEGTYGSVETPTLALPFVSANVNEQPELIASKALVGMRFAPQARRGMSLVKGTLVTEVNPDILPTLIWLICGAEAAVAPVMGASGAYDHVFTPVTGVALPSFCMVLDKGPDIFLYTGCKINTAKIGVSTKDLMTMTIDFTGQQEAGGASTEAIVISTKAPFTYAGFTAKTGTAGSIAGTSTDYVETIDITYDNKLDADRYRAIGTTYTGEIDANGCEVKFGIKADLTDDTNTLREDFFKTATTISCQAAYITDEFIVATTAYALTVDMLYGSIPAFDLDIPGPDRLSVSFDLDAKDGTAGTVSITVRDGNNALVVPA
jgi:hypothetical protein